MRKEIKNKNNYEKRINRDFIKKSLNMIILILLNEKPASGFELIEQINKKFGILFGPSTIYPILYSFEEHGLLSSAKEGKNIKYKIKNRQKVHKILYHHFSLRRTLEKMMGKKFNK